MRHGSKTSLKDIVDPEEQSSESGDGNSNNTSKPANSNKTEDSSSKFSEDLDNDGDLDDDENETPLNSLPPSSTPMAKQPQSKLPPPQQLLPGGNVANAQTPKSEASEQSFLLSRLGDETMDSLLEKQESSSSTPGEEKKKKASSSSNLRLNDYYSEPEMSPVTSPLGSRPGTPNILSDTEYETNLNKEGQEDGLQGWEWGKLPSSTHHHGAKDAADGKDKDKDAKAKAEEEANRQRSWTFSSLWKGGSSSAGGAAAEKEAKKRQQQREEVPGVYLDELKQDDEEMLSLYVGSSRHSGGEHGSGLMMTAPSGVRDDDAESGNGPSLPMSPHSVEGAIGGGRVRYDSSDEEKHLRHQQLP